MSDKILDRLRNLLGLASSLNVNKLADAVGQAQKLMTRHYITEAMSSEPEDDGPIEDGLLSVAGARVHTWESFLAASIAPRNQREAGTRLPKWKAYLADTIAMHNQCEVYTLNGEIRVVGHQQSTTPVRYLFNFAAWQIDRLCKAAREESDVPGQGTRANNVRLSAIIAIREKLEEAAKQARAEMRREANAKDAFGTGDALARVNGAITKIDQRSNAVRASTRPAMNPASGTRATDPA